MNDMIGKSICTIMRLNNQRSFHQAPPLSFHMMLLVVVRLLSERFSKTYCRIAHLIRRTTTTVVGAYKCGDLYNRAELWRQSVIKVDRDSRAHRRGAERPAAGPSLAVP